MKTAFALISALFLIGAQATAIGQPVAQANFGCHCDRACCSASQSDNQQPVPAVPAPVSFQYQPLTLASASLVWEVPAAPARDGSISEPASFASSDVPVFARLCVLLI